MFAEFFNVHSLLIFKENHSLLFPVARWVNVFGLPGKLAEINAKRMLWAGYFHIDTELEAFSCSEMGRAQENALDHPRGWLLLFLAATSTESSTVFRL